MMKIKEIREMTAAERDNQLKDLRQEQFKLGIQAKTGQLENSARIRQVRRTIARVLTVKNEPSKS